MKLRKFGALAASAVFLAAACTAAPGTGDGKGEIEIWSQLPRQGSSKAQTDTIVNAIKLRLEQAGNAVDGWTIKYVDQDDSTAEAGKWTPERTTDIATQAVANEKIVAYIGSFNSGAAKIGIPILCQAGIPMISPANTYPGLTVAEGAEPGEPDKYYPGGCKRNYVRVVPNDNLQGTAAAAWAKSLGATKVYVLDDTEIYGKGIADKFESTANEIGLTVLGRDAAPGRSTDFKALASKVKAAGPDLVFYGGITQNNAGQLWKDLREAMPNVKLMGPDGILESAFIEAAGAAGEGTLITFGGGDPENYSGDAAKFKSEYEAKYPGSKVEAYTIYGYEAANVLIAAIEKASKDGAKDVKELRSKTIDNLFATKDFTGVTGTFSFDQNGDTSTKLFTGFELKGGSFTFSAYLSSALQ
jgi:branched-chain amino acid transport system substrate-binding protein